MTSVQSGSGPLLSATAPQITNPSRPSDEVINLPGLLQACMDNPPAVGLDLCGATHTTNKTIISAARLLQRLKRIVGP